MHFHDPRSIGNAHPRPRHIEGQDKAAPALDLALRSLRLAPAPFKKISQNDRVAAASRRSKAPAWKTGHPMAAGP